MLEFRINGEGVVLGIVLVVVILQNGFQECPSAEVVDQFEVNDIGGVEAAGIDIEPLEYIVQARPNVATGSEHDERSKQKPRSPLVVGKIDLIAIFAIAPQDKIPNGSYN